jgi:hypothetical protein
MRSREIEEEKSQNGCGEEAEKEKRRNPFRRNRISRYFG